MTLLQKLMGKKTKALQARCPITRENIESTFGYLLTTAQVVSSPPYWDLVMTEPETLSYTLAHFNQEGSGTQMRELIFEKYSTVEKPWMVSDTCISLFDQVDRKQARENALKWWESQGQFVPDNSGPALATLNPDSYRTAKDYAVLEAGRKRASMARAGR